MNETLGYTAALFTSLCWTVSSVFFTRAGLKVGSVVVNQIRLPFALSFLLLAHFAIGFPPFANIESFRWIWFGISGAVGLALGDAFLFQAYILIGPRISMLLMSLSPILASLGGWIFLHEQLTLLEIFAIILTVGGIAWVILERNGRKNRPISETRQYVLGVMMGFAAAISQTIGLITSKLALVDGFPALTGTLIRVLTATLVLWSITLLSGKMNRTILSLKSQPTALKIIAAGALFGPVIGVTFSLLAVQNAPVGIATTLMALPPILLLPVGYFFFKEQFGWKAVLGTFVAISGVAVLFIM